MDLFGIPDGQVADVQFFPGNSAAGNTNWQVWNKPRGCSLVLMMGIGGGGGGGAGFTRTAGSAGGGGGSGGTGGMAWCTQAAMFLPDTLFINSGKGGPSASAGQQSVVSLSPDTATTQQNRLLAANGGGAGGTGTGAAAGAAATAAAATAATDMRLGLFLGHGFLAGTVGIIGGAQTGAVGANTAAVTTGQRATAGAGGAGCTTTDFAGGNVIASSLVQQINGGATAGGNGNSGIWLPKIGYSVGGAGGGSNNSGVGGKGGDGGFGGSGGGGGGAGATGGAGGRGGDGYVIIVALR